jgi:nucleoside-diphosphate-sugar epimerase
MKVLLTGGTGFVGSYLIKELLLAGHEVVATRRSGSMPVISLIENPVWIDRSFIELTLGDLEDVDTIVHLASAGVSPKRASWADLEQVNVAAGLQLIDLAHQAGVRRFVATGTCLEYGAEASAWQFIPPSAALRPVTPYGASKAAGFFMLNSYASNHSIEFFYGRIFTAYGEGQYAANLWPSLYAAALAGSDFPMTSGEQIRDFISVQEVAKHLRVAVERSDLIPGQPLVVNIGSGTGLSVLDFVMNEWQRLRAQGSLRPGALPSRVDQTDRLVADPILLIPNP